MRSRCFMKVAAFLAGLSAWVLSATAGTLAVRTARADRSDYDAPGSGIGVLVEGGGGVFSFARGQIASVTQVGGDWNVRAIFGTRWFIGGEVAYVGSVNTIGLGGLLNTNATLLGSGIEGALRLQLPIPIGRRGLVQPYVLGGVGWTRYDVLNANGSVNSLASGDNGLAVPVGGGLLFGYNHFMFDVRANYRFGFYNNPITADSSSGTDSWYVNLLLGYEF